MSHEEKDNWTPEQIIEFKNAGRFRIGSINAPRNFGVLGRGGPMPAADPQVAADTHLVAEGDSWFDYPPGTDLIDCLRNRGHRIDNFATHGDTLENMIFGTKCNEDCTPESSSIYRVLKRVGQIRPRVLLFSGGGNDVAGDEFGSFLNHSESGLSLLREEYVDYMMNTVFRAYYKSLIEKVKAVSPNTYIVTHGYGHTIPTGKGVRFLFRDWVGPWLLPALAQKRIEEPTRRFELVRTMIDTFNDLLKNLAQEHPSFIYVDLRRIIDPQSDWVNELHLRNSAFARAADEIHVAITNLPQQLGGVAGNMWN